MTPTEALDAALAEAADESTTSILTALYALGFTVARTQDAADGEALRLLREASPGGESMSLWQGDLPPHHFVTVQPQGDRAYLRQGPTIAAAADSCRAAIEATR